MKIYRWEEVKTERLSESSSRQVILGNNIMLTMNRSKAGRRIPGHRHEELMQYVLEGKIKYKSESQEKIIQAGEVIHIAEGEWHEIEIIEDIVVLDVFSPPKRDYLESTENYLRVS